MSLIVSNERVGLRVAGSHDLRMMVTLFAAVPCFGARLLNGRDRAVQRLIVDRELHGEDVPPITLSNLPHVHAVTAFLSASAISPVSRLNA